MIVLVDLAVGRTEEKKNSERETVANRSETTTTEEQAIINQKHYTAYLLRRASCRTPTAPEPSPQIPAAEHRPPEARDQTKQPAKGRSSPPIHISI